MAGGLGMHHAGMLRSDRNLVERLFRDGVIKVPLNWTLHTRGHREDPAFPCDVLEPHVLPCAPCAEQGLYATWQSNWHDS